MGADGIVLWDDHNLCRNKTICSQLKLYLEKTLGPFVLDVLENATTCSNILCNGHGRCIKRSGNYGQFYEKDKLLYKVYKSKDTLHNINGLCGPTMKS